MFVGLLVFPMRMSVWTLALLASPHVAFGFEWAPGQRVPTFAARQFRGTHDVKRIEDLATLFLALNSATLRPAKALAAPVMAYSGGLNSKWEPSWSKDYATKERPKKVERKVRTPDQNKEYQGGLTKWEPQWKREQVYSQSKPKQVKRAAGGLFFGFPLGQNKQRREVGTRTTAEASNAIAARRAAAAKTLADKKALTAKKAAEAKKARDERAAAAKKAVEERKAAAAKKAAEKKATTLAKRAAVANTKGVTRKVSVQKKTEATEQKAERANPFAKFFAAKDGDDKDTGKRSPLISKRAAVAKKSGATEAKRAAVAKKAIEERKAAKSIKKAPGTKKAETKKPKQERSNPLQELFAQIR